MGMITLANSNASIGMAISAESLRAKIDKIKELSVIEYVKDSRPQNALSSVLDNIGYRIDDMYDEKDILAERSGNKSENTDNQNENKQNNSNNNQSNGSNNNSNNTNGNNKNNQSTQLPIINKLDGIKKVIVNPVIQYSESLKKNAIKLQIEYKDSDSVTLKVTPQHQFLSKVKLILYHSPFEVSNAELNTMRKVFDSDYTGNNLRNIEKNGAVEVPLDQIKSQLSTEDYNYAGGEHAVIYYDLTVTTKEQGSFSTSGGCFGIVK